MKNVKANFSFVIVWWPRDNKILHVNKKPVMIGKGCSKIVLSCHLLPPSMPHLFPPHLILLLLWGLPKILHIQSVYTVLSTLSICLPISLKPRYYHSNMAYRLIKKQPWVNIGYSLNGGIALYGICCTQSVCFLILHNYIVFYFLLFCRLIDWLIGRMS